MRLQWMIGLYPHAWQERYGDEIQAVLEQHKLTVRTFFDIATNALDARLDPGPWGERSFYPMEPFKRLRRSTGLIFLTYIALLLSYVVFLSSLGDIFDWTIRHNPLTNFLNGILSNLMALQLVALLVALFLVASALAFQKGAISSKYLKFLPLLLVLFPTVMAGFYFGCQFFPNVICHLDFGWGNFVYPSLLLVVPFVAIVLLKSDVSQRILKIAWLALAFIVVGMLIQMMLVLTWGILAWSTTQQTAIRLAQGYDRTLYPGDYHIWLALGLVCVFLFGGTAIAALVHGLPAWWIKDGPRAEQ